MCAQVCGRACVLLHIFFAVSCAPLVWAPSRACPATLISCWAPGEKGKVQGPFPSRSQLLVYTFSKSGRPGPTLQLILIRGAPIHQAKVYTSGQVYTTRKNCFWQGPGGVGNQGIVVGVCVGIGACLPTCRPSTGARPAMVGHAAPQRRMDACPISKHRPDTRCFNNSVVRCLSGGGA